MNNTYDEYEKIDGRYLEEDEIKKLLEMEIPTTGIELYNTNIRSDEVVEDDEEEAPAVAVEEKRVQRSAAVQETLRHRVAEIDRQLADLSISSVTRTDLITMCVGLVSQSQQPSEEAITRLVDLGVNPRERKKKATKELVPNFSPRVTRSKVKK